MNESNYSIFVYQYRDAANYKAHGVLMLFGQYDAGIEEKIRKSCDSWNHFVAEQVGVPTLYAELYMFSNGPTIDDVAFHEFHSLRPATIEEGESLPLWGKLGDLLARFEAVRFWDCTLSPHC